MTDKESENEEKRPRSGILSRILEWIRVKLIGTLLRVRRKYWIIVVSLIVAMLLLIGAILILSVSAAVKNKTEDQILDLNGALTQGQFDCILVLGCRVWENGEMSDMLADRVDTGLQLYHANASDLLVMSGDSENAQIYDEVGAMRNAALAAGVREGAILTDPYGLSTYDSLIRLRDRYGMKRILIVTQEYHLYRAIYIAEKLGMEAIGVRADLRTYQKQLLRELREIPARFKDVYSALRQPAPKYAS